jgi:N-acetylglucosamine-6-phosphate deacetylase
MILKNAIVCSDTFEKIQACVHINGERISGIFKESPAENIGIDLRGCTILPGLIDMHIHGAAGADVCDATSDAIDKISGYLASRGVTTFCATTMTSSCLELEHVIKNVVHYMKGSPTGARIHGIHLEGPFLCAGKCGVQNEKYILAPDIEYFKRLNDCFPGVISIVDVAPEGPNGMSFIEEASKICPVSLSHSDADYDTAREAISHGLSHVSHLFNAMRPIGHRDPGAVLAVFDDKQVTAELICDGIHLHPAIIRMAFTLLGRDRTIVVSDSMRAAGMPDGEYVLGDREVLVYDKRTSYANGRLAGSTTSMIEELKNLVQIGIPWDHAVRSATINPARRLGVDAETGSIACGKYADITVIDSEMNVVMTMVRGKIVYRAEVWEQRI